MGIILHKRCLWCLWQISSLSSMIMMLTIPSIYPAELKIQILKGRTGSCKAWELAAKQSVSARPIEWRVKQWTMRVVWNEERIDKKGRWGSEARGADDEGRGGRLTSLARCFAFWRTSSKTSTSMFFFKNIAKTSHR